jgi:hypothetical protein
MAWALWNGPKQKAAKLHLQFDVLKAVPGDATVTPAASSEPDQLRALLTPAGGPCLISELLNHCQLSNTLSGYSPHRFDYSCYRRLNNAPNPHARARRTHFHPDHDQIVPPSERG